MSKTNAVRSPARQATSARRAPGESRGRRWVVDELVLVDERALELLPD